MCVNYCVVLSCETKNPHPLNVCISTWQRSTGISTSTANQSYSNLKIHIMALHNIFLTNLKKHFRSCKTCFFKFSAWFEARWFLLQFERPRQRASGDSWWQVKLRLWVQMEGAFSGAHTKRQANQERSPFICTLFLSPHPPQFQQSAEATP